MGVAPLGPKRSVVHPAASGQIVGYFFSSGSVGAHGFLATSAVIPVQIEVEPFVPKDPWAKWIDVVCERTSSEADGAPGQR